MKHAPALIAVTLSLTLVGCASTPAGGLANAHPVNPLAQYSLQVEPGIDRIALSVHDRGLSANQHAALRALVSRFDRAQAPVLRIEAPSGDDRSASAQAHATRDAILAMGVPSQNVQLVGYQAPDSRAPILAGFETLRASIPDCSAEPRSFGPRASNTPTGALGCAITANMAAQISNPRDIVAPRAAHPADSGRAAVVFARYRLGQLTAAPQETLVEGRISQAVD